MLPRVRLGNLQQFSSDTFAPHTFGYHQSGHVGGVFRSSQTGTHLDRDQSPTRPFTTDT